MSTQPGKFFTATGVTGAFSRKASVAFCFPPLDGSEAEPEQEKNAKGCWRSACACCSAQAVAAFSIASKAFGGTAGAAAAGAAVAAAAAAKAAAEAEAVQDEPVAEEVVDAPVEDVPAAPAPKAEPTLIAKGLDGPGEQIPLQYSAPSDDGSGQTVVSGDGSRRARRALLGESTAVECDGRTFPGTPLNA